MPHHMAFLVVIAVSLAGSLGLALLAWLASVGLLKPARWFQPCEDSHVVGHEQHASGSIALLASARSVPALGDEDCRDVSLLRAAAAPLLVRAARERAIDYLLGCLPLSSRMLAAAEDRAALSEVMATKMLARCKPSAQTASAI